ncbi:hypothetical protein [Natrialba sp. SSL1]|uniref:hypothetical protein n=1 Tax=Natrialba sp. SSL1 TaxID=1869245 RepID=UPI0008F85177|nr:hypothetical protein [Natrialba sp. SSL1]OIB57872.1 hypothetical protein BBD46_10765 [Natrialba sp. SSL1]
MCENRRAGTQLLGLGVGLVVLSIAVGFIFTTLLSDEFVRSLSTQQLVQYPHPFVGLFDPLSVGIVYLVFGALVLGWTRTTRSKELPFAATLPTAMLAVVAVIGFELASSAATTTHGFGLERVWSMLLASPLETVRETVVAVPSLWVGYYLAWLLTYEVASTRRQRIVPLVGIAVLPLLVATDAIRAAQRTLETGGAGAGLGYAAASMLIPASLLGILVAVVFATPWYVLRNLRNRPNRGPVDESNSATQRQAIRDRHVPEFVAFLGLFLAFTLVSPLQFGTSLLEPTRELAMQDGCGSSCSLLVVLSQYIYAALLATGVVLLGRHLWNRVGPASGTAPRTD